jgi:uncharacterized glyoxalase superfamily protein PhnB
VFNSGVGLRDGEFRLAARLIYDRREQEDTSMPEDPRPNIFPSFKYQDAPAAIVWLERAFGFRKQAVHAGPDGTIGHAELTLGAGAIMLGSKGLADPVDPWAAASQGVYVFVPDADEHYARARAAGATIVRELADTPYGSREYSARDSEGNLWSFGTYYPGAPAEPAVSSGS